MSVYLVTWDLNREGAGYALAKARLDRTLETFNRIRDNGLDSTIFIESNASATECYKHIAQALDKNDRLVVTKLNPQEMTAHLHDDVWTWLNNRI
jgi:coenzyme F420-reducing hydrogenase alpha subunit